MQFTLAEKLQVAMMCDLAKPPQERELDFDFIYEAVANDDLWAIAWRYPGLQLSAVKPQEVEDVCEVLQMWEDIEESFEKLNQADKDMVVSRSHFSNIAFPGFDGNDEQQYHRIANVIVNQVGRFLHFKTHGDLNSHRPMMKTYKRLLPVWSRIKEEKRNALPDADWSLSTDELIMIVRERVDPSLRQDDKGGHWTIGPAVRNS